MLSSQVLIMDIRMQFNDISSTSFSLDPPTPEPQDPETMCPECGASFLLSNAVAHVEKDHPEMAETLDCGDSDSLVRLGDASLHLLECHPDITTFQCPVCWVMCSPPQVTRHLEDFHLPSALTPYPSLLETAQLTSQLPHVECSVCGEWLAPDVIAKHMVDHHGDSDIGIECPICESEFVAANICTHMMSH